MVSSIEYLCIFRIFVFLGKNLQDSVVSRWFLRFFSRFLCRRLSFLRRSIFHPLFFGYFLGILAPVHIHFIRYICVQVLACDTKYGRESKAETDSGHAHSRRPVFQCNTYISAASKSHTHVDKFLPFLDLALGLWRGGWVGEGVSTTHWEDFHAGSSY